MSEMVYVDERKISITADEYGNLELRMPSSKVIDKSATAPLLWVAILGVATRLRDDPEFVREAASWPIERSLGKRT